MGRVCRYRGPGEVLPQSDPSEQANCGESRDRSLRLQGRHQARHHGERLAATRVRPAPRIGCCQAASASPWMWPQCVKRSPRGTDPMSSRIEDYALIGDCQTAALVSREGSVDWLCLPRFDSAACFAALLGTPEHGRWLLAPKEEVRQSRRRYRDDTLILETDYRTDSGEVTVIDFMPVRSDHLDLVRIVEGRRGQVPMQMEFVVRFDYGSLVPWVRREYSGIVAIAGPDVVHLRSD